MNQPYNLDFEMRISRLEEVIQKQTELLEMAVDCGCVWQHESSAPENNRLPDFYLKLAECFGILKVQLRHELETRDQTSHSDIVLQ
jgi:hypothetical protein